MKTKLLFLLAAVCLSLSAGRAQDQVSGTFGENNRFVWTVNNGILTIDGNGRIASPASTVPWQAYIGDIREVVLESGITGCALSFNYPSLISATFPETLTTFDGLFTECRLLTSIISRNPTPIQVSSAVFDGLDLSTACLVVPEEAEALYRADNRWQSFGVIAPDRGTFGTDKPSWSFGRDRTLTVSGSGEVPRGYELTWEPAFRAVIKTVIIGDSVTAIGDFAFDGCSALASVILPASLTAIGDFAFADCSALTGITNMNPAPLNINSNVFTNVKPGPVTLYVPYPSDAAYKSTPVWNNFKTVNIATVSGVTLNKASIVIPSGSVAWLTATVQPSYATNQNVTWTSSNPFVFRVSQAGALVAVNPGEATVVVRTEEGGFGATCAVEVRESTGIIRLDAATTDIPARIAGGILYVDTPASEQIRIYSAAGKYLFGAEKPAGKASLSLPPALTRSEKILIIRSNSGWAGKVIVN